VTPVGRDALAAILSAAAALGAVALATRNAPSALVDFGPNDADYVRGFRRQWEREGETGFHWTSPSATVTLPLRARGEGHVLRARLRRHFIEPARVTLRVEGSIVSVFDVQADRNVAYRTIEVPLPRLEGRHPFVLAIEAPSENPRPLGIALDWLELRRSSGAVLVALGSTLAAAALVGLVAFQAPRLAGASLWVSLAHAAFVVGGLGAGTAAHVIAAERVLREGTAVYVAVAFVSVALVRARASRRFFGIDAAAIGGLLTIVVLVALSIRLALLLHQQFYYPDVRVHGLLAWELARRGIASFLASFTEHQYRYSLGLQLVNGHWYAFPYPPLFYLLTWPLTRLASYRPEVAVSVLAAAVNSLEVLVVFGVARRLSPAVGTALAAAAAVPVLPIFIVRLGLAYFPAIVGHAVDSVVLLYLLTRLAVLERPRVVLALSGLLALALLTYTQSLLNFGILLPLFLLLQIAYDRTPGARARQAGLVLASVLAGLLAGGVFYGRYVPIVADMRKGVPMPEERILLEKMEQRRRLVGEEPPEPSDDPYSGPGVNPWRGLRKAAWRLYVFYGVFSPIVVAGVVVVARSASHGAARLVTAWALTYLLLNLASGGLPGPNLVRYNKDMEVVAPLACVGLGLFATWLWSRGRLWAIAFAGAFWSYGAGRAWQALTSTFAFDR
jgi:hypothetical protein